VSSVALTFFAFLGFGVVTFTAKDLTNPSQQLPRAIYLALGIATTIYVAVALGVFGTLTVGEVISSGGTALAVAAEPVLGRAGYWLMSVTALFSTAGATNAGLYPAAASASRWRRLASSHRPSVAGSEGEHRWDCWSPPRSRSSSPLGST
jgi:amino acid transporter